MANIKCPNCAREFVRRVSRVGLIENILGFFYVYPFKCQICGFRFRYFQRGVRYIRIEEDRRVYDRLAIDCPVAFSGDDCVGEGGLTDVSMGGCNFLTDSAVTAGAIVKMALDVSNDVQPIIVDAAVLRYVRPEGIGAEFLRWPAGERERLQQYIRGLLIERDK